jgi:AcrR family transcriptional regulator
MSTASAPVPPRRRGRPNPVSSRAPRRLSRDAVIDVALAVLDAEGLDAVTMRRVADELETGPASLYAHVGDKVEMVEAVLDRVIGEIPLPHPVDPARWMAQLKELCVASRAVFARHRDIARAALGIVPTGEQSLPLIETILALLHAGGVSDRVAALSVDIIGLYLVATGVEESVEAAAPHETHIEYYMQLRDFWAALPPDRFPRINAMAVSMTTGDDDERFEFGLDLLLRGIASTVDA